MSRFAILATMIHHADSLICSAFAATAAEQYCQRPASLARLVVGPHQFTVLYCRATLGQCKTSPRGPVMLKNPTAKFDFKPFLMTPEQHRRQAEMLRARHQDQLAKEHELLAHTIAGAQLCVAAEDEIAD